MFWKEVLIPSRPNVPYFMEISDLETSPAWAGPWLEVDLPWIDNLSRIAHSRGLINSVNSSPFWNRPQIPPLIQDLIANGVSPHLDWTNPALLKRLARRNAISTMENYSFCRKVCDLKFCLLEIKEALIKGFLIEVPPKAALCYMKFFPQKTPKGNEG